MRRSSISLRNGWPRSRKYYERAKQLAVAIKGQNVLPNFKELRDKKMNEKEEEHQQDRRQKNLMVFGASKSKEVTDEVFIKDLIKDIGVNSEVKFFTQIRNQTKN